MYILFAMIFSLLFTSRRDFHKRLWTSLSEQYQFSQFSLHIPTYQYTIFQRYESNLHCQHAPRLHKSSFTLGIVLEKVHTKLLPPVIIHLPSWNASECRSGCMRPPSMSTSTISTSMSMTIPIMSITPMSMTIAFTFDLGQQIHFIIEFLQCSIKAIGANITPYFLAPARIFLELDILVQKCLYVDVSIHIGYTGRTGPTR
mmetsp:Transcript_16425/g.20787  ORF Transcript_16425/g.20787 Transcript_16425/m.20787 type:complete len:201 (+) Transcript_16425:264-866(+)